MTKHRLETGTDKNPAEPFLRSRVRQRGKPDRKRIPDLPADGTAEALYPDRPHGDAFVQQAMTALQKSTRFAVLVIAVDAELPEGTLGESADANACRQAIYQVLDQMVPQLPVIWGVLENLQLGCFLPDADADAGRRLARQVKQSLAERCRQTVTIGIADYPCLDFRKEQILDNARKALEHARFFGPDSLVAFDAISLNISADRLYDAGDIDAAVAEFHRALQLDAGDANIHNSLGVCYGVTGDLSQPSSPPPSNSMRVNRWHFTTPAWSAK